ncbi:MAG: hypothetical protein ACK55K_05740 [Bacteroidota bacterium]|jgi:hypothetical protein
MILHINDSRMLREIQLDFSRFYPYLRIEFYKNEAPVKELLNDEMKIDPYVKAGSVRNKHHSGSINIFPNTTIINMKKWMLDEFNLYVQIFHYTFNGWECVTDTEDCTLDELNEKGRHTFHELHNVSAQVKNLF